MTDLDLDPDAVEEANVAAAAGHAEHLLKHAIETHATVGPGNRAAAELLAVVLQSLSAIESPTRQ